MKTFKLDDIFNAAVDLNIEFQLGVECFRRLYSWGSVSTHYAWRMERHELWHSLRSIQHVQGSGLIICRGDELEEKIDAILDRLIMHDKIKIE